jgi:hypothetical protein
MTEYVVPMGTPEFFHVATPVTGAGYTWAGAYPYIDTADLGASYGEINTATTGDAGGQWVGSVLPAYVAPAGIIGARVDLQMNILALDSTFYGPLWRLACDDVGTPWLSGGGHYPSSVVGWNTIADDVEPFDGQSGVDIPAMLAALASGNMRLYAHQPQDGATWQLSYLRLTLISDDAPNLTGQLLDDRVRFT